MSNIANNRDLFRDVCRLLGINPDERRITELTLRMAVDELPTVEIVEFATHPDGEQEATTRKYRIEPMDQWGPRAGASIKAGPVVSVGKVVYWEEGGKSPIDYTGWPIGGLTGKPLAPSPELARDIVFSGNYVAEAVTREFDFSTCPDCKGTRQYQPLTGPAEPCRTCCGKAES